MRDWKEVKLGEFIKTNVSNVGKDFPYQEILYLDTGSITANKIEKLQRFKLSDAPSRAKRLVKEEDIIYSSVRPNQLHYGFIRNPVENLVVSTGFVVITCNKEFILPRFLYYFLSSNNSTEYLHSIAEASTSAYPSLKSSDIEALEILLPPLPEQKAIASVLSSLDDKIDLLHQQNQTLEALAETLFRQWFIEEAKEDWEQLRIVDLFEVKDGTHDSPKQKEFGKKLITSKHLFNFYIDLNSAYFISEEDYYNINKRSKVEKGDILFSMIGTIGKIYLEDSENIDYAIKNIGLFKTSQNLNWRYFTYLWLKSNLGRDFIFENISGSTQEYISLGSLRSINFKVPNIETVNLFNTKVKTLFDKLYINQQQIQTLTKLCDTLLPKLMSGEVRVEM